MSIPRVVQNVLGLECGLRCVVHAKRVVLTDYRIWVRRWAQFFVGDVTYSSCAGVVYA
jgi:hypothetical protein